jgi:hypothetical protein
VPDTLWPSIAPILLEPDPPYKGRRPRTDRQTALERITCPRRTGCNGTREAKAHRDWLEERLRAALAGLLEAAQTSESRAGGPKAEAKLRRVGPH